MLTLMPPSRRARLARLPRNGRIERTYPVRPEPETTSGTVATEVILPALACAAGAMLLGLILL